MRGLTIVLTVLVVATFMVVAFQQRDSLRGEVERTKHEVELARAEVAESSKEVNAARAQLASANLALSLAQRTIDLQKGMIEEMQAEQAKRLKLADERGQVVEVPASRPTFSRPLTTEAKRAALLTEHEKLFPHEQAVKLTDLLLSIQPATPPIPGMQQAPASHSPDEVRRSIVEIVGEDGLFALTQAARHSGPGPATSPLAGWNRRLR